LVVRGQTGCALGMRSRHRRAVPWDVPRARRPSCPTAASREKKKRKVKEDTGRWGRAVIEIERGRR
jgi:hypothetical protein